jgi:hypothetical protein
MICSLAILWYWHLIVYLARFRRRDGASGSFAGIDQAGVNDS